NHGRDAASAAGHHPARARLYARSALLSKRDLRNRSDRATTESRVPDLQFFVRTRQLEANRVRQKGGRFVLRSVDGFYPQAHEFATDRLEKTDERSSEGFGDLSGETKIATQSGDGRQAALGIDAGALDQHQPSLHGA